MPRENKTKFALLGLLAMKPMSGYDMKKTIERSFGNFWNESYGQIYPILKTLLTEGLVSVNVEKNAGKPDRNIYSITKPGIEILLKWLKEPPEPQKERVEVLLKMMFGHILPIEKTIEHITKFKNEHRDTLSRHKKIEEHLMIEYQDEPRLPFWLSTVRCSIHISQAYIDWCDETLKTFLSMKD